MPIQKLSSAQITKSLAPGRYGDGGGLWLQVSKWKTKSWIFQFTSPVTRKIRQLGLGPYSAHDVTLQQARQKAAEARKMVRDGLDPVDVRLQKKKQRQIEHSRSLTFSEAATKYMQAHAPKWRNDKHRSQWTATLRTYVFPVFGRTIVSEIDRALVMRTLEPIWFEKPETAKRLRGRIESILDWATVREYRTGPNPARWKGYLDRLLPAPSSVRPVSHHAAMPFSEVEQFVAELADRPGIAASALNVAILTALRTSEVIESNWDEIDFSSKIWTIPASRMKASREHRVPLTEPVIRILQALPRETENPFVFIGGRKGRPLSNMAMLKLLKGMRRNLTVHGFRSTFRDWAAEVTTHQNHVVEMALAHAVGNKVEAAYRRGDLLEKRWALMTDWSNFCCNSANGANIVSFKFRAEDENDNSAPDDEAERVVA